jgi:hypothetical protein
MGLTALPTLCFERSFAIAWEELLQKLIKILQALIVPSDSGKSLKAIYGLWLEFCIMKTVMDIITNN